MDPEFGFYYNYLAELLKKAKDESAQRELEIKVDELEEQEKPTPEDDHEQ